MSDVIGARFELQTYRSRDERVTARPLTGFIKRTKFKFLFGVQVRRKQPLPANIEPPRFVRSVIAINLPMSSPTIESVTSLFAAYGDLTQVRILKPGKKLPSYLTDYQAVSSNIDIDLFCCFTWSNFSLYQFHCAEDSPNMNL